MQKRGGRHFAAAAVFFVLLTGIRAWAAEYRYDDQGRLVRVIYDNGNYVEYQYDKNGNLLEISESRAEAETTPAETGEPETGGTAESGEPETGGTEESGGPETGGTEESGGPETGGTEESGGPETGGTEESGGPETGGTEESGGPEADGGSETKNPGGDKDDGSDEEDDTWRSMLKEWLNQMILRYRQWFRYLQQWLQSLTELLKRENS